MKNGVHISGQDKLKKLLANIKTLPGRQVLVGIPGDDGGASHGGSNLRTENVGGSNRAISDITNAQLGYIHEFGAPEVGIPGRPFLIPGIRDAQKKIEVHLAAAGRAALAGNKTQQEANLHAAGLTAVNSVRKRIQGGIPPPLADSTLRARARRKKGQGHQITKGAIAELAARAKGIAPSTTYAKPLIDTGQLLASITYVIRNSK